MTTYTCKACNAQASVLQGAVVPNCKCAAPIIAHLRAVASGAGTANKGA